MDNNNLFRRLCFLANNKVLEKINKRILEFTSKISDMINKLKNYKEDYYNFEDLTRLAKDNPGIISEIIKLFLTIKHPRSLKSRKKIAILLKLIPYNVVELIKRYFDTHLKEEVEKEISELSHISDDITLSVLEEFFYIYYVTEHVKPSHKVKEFLELAEEKSDKTSKILKIFLEGENLFLDPEKKIAILLLTLSEIIESYEYTNLLIEKLEDNIKEKINKELKKISTLNYLLYKFDDLPAVVRASVIGEFIFSFWKFYRKDLYNNNAFLFYEEELNYHFPETYSLNFFPDRREFNLLVIDISSTKYFPWRWQFAFKYDNTIFLEILSQGHRGFKIHSSTTKDCIIKFTWAFFFIVLIIKGDDVFLMVFDMLKSSGEEDFLLFSSEKIFRLYINKNLFENKVKQKQTDYIQEISEVPKENSAKTHERQKSNGMETIIEKKQKEDKKTLIKTTKKYLQEHKALLQKGKELVNKKWNKIDFNKKQLITDGLTVEKKRLKLIKHDLIPEDFNPSPLIHPISIEVGYKFPISFNNYRSNLLKRCESIRKHIEMEVGFLIPNIHIEENREINPESYKIKIKGIEVAIGEIRTGRLLSIGSEDFLNNLEGIKCFEPAYGMPAVWIKPELIKYAERAGCVILDPISVIAEEITEVINLYVSNLLGVKETESLLGKIKETHPALINEVYPNFLNLKEIRIILQNLLREHVSIEDMITILETLADYVTITRDTDILTEYVRKVLSTNICRKYQINGIIQVITFDEKIEKFIENNMRNKTLQSNKLKKLLKVLGEKIQLLINYGIKPVILSSPIIRFYLKRLTWKSFPHLIILSYNEITDDIKIKNIICIKL